MSQAQGELSIIRQKNQPFGVKIQTPDSAGNLPFSGQEFIDRPPSQFIFVGTDASWRFVQGNVKLFAFAELAAIHRNLVVDGIHFCSQLEYHLAVYSYLPGKDHLLRGAARRHAGIGHEFLQTDDSHVKPLKC
jgi:hypothetical protein